MTGKVTSFKSAEAIKSIIPGFRIEAERSGKMLCVIISGVVKVESFSVNEIEVVTLREVIKINGKMLKISVFEYKNIEISGEIESFCFLEKVRRRRRKSET